MYSSQKHCKVNTTIISILMMIKWRPREIKELAQGYRAKKWQNQDSNSGSLPSGSMLLTTELKWTNRCYLKHQETEAQTYYLIGNLKPLEE